jgi:predicted RNase H-like nuclease (RuvC/YqgF family)
MGFSIYNILKTALAVGFISLLGSFGEQFGTGVPGLMFGLVLTLFVVIAAMRAIQEAERYRPLLKLKESLPPAFVEGLMQVASPAEFIDFVDNSLANANENAMQFEAIAKEAQANQEAMRKELQAANIALEQSKSNYTSAYNQLVTSIKQLEGAIKQSQSELEVLKSEFAPFLSNDLVGMQHYYRSKVGHINRLGAKKNKVNN